jgi:hypothetical protein
VGGARAGAAGCHGRHCRLQRLARAAAAARAGRACGLPAPPAARPAAVAPHTGPPRARTAASLPICTHPPLPAACLPDSPLAALMLFFPPAVSLTSELAAGRRRQPVFVMHAQEPEAGWSSADECAAHTEACSGRVHACACAGPAGGPKAALREVSLSARVARPS